MFGYTLRCHNVRYRLQEYTLHNCCIAHECPVNLSLIPRAPAGPKSYFRNPNASSRLQGEKLLSCCRVTVPVFQYLFILRVDLADQSLFLLYQNLFSYFLIQCRTKTNLFTELHSPCLHCIHFFLLTVLKFGQTGQLLQQL